MAGHNKWSKIKRQKAITDAKRSSLFSKLSRAITVASRQGGPDIDSNITLRTIVEKAKLERMPKDNIQKAIEKGSGLTSSNSYESMVYEGYGPGGVAFLIKALTDNRNRTVAEIRTIFNKYDGALGLPGSTSYIFGESPDNPTFEIEVENHEVAVKITTMIELFEDNEDVQEVYTNLIVSDELAQNL